MIKTADQLTTILSSPGHHWHHCGRGGLHVKYAAANGHHTLIVARRDAYPTETEYYQVKREAQAALLAAGRLSRNWANVMFESSGGWRFHSMEWVEEGG